MTYNNLQDFLAQSGVLETGDKEAIEKAKYEYRKLYTQAYKKEYAKKRKCVGVTLTIPEYDKVREKTLIFDLSVPQFLRQCALEKIGVMIMQPYPNHYAEVLQDLSRYKEAIKELKHISKDYMTIYQSYERVIIQVDQLQAKLLGL